MTDPTPTTTAARTHNSPLPEHLLPRQLAARWHTSVQYLANQRSAGMGPPYLKLNARVLYRLADIEAYEAARVVAAVS